MRRLTRKKQQQSTAPAHQRLTASLDALNVSGTLQRVRQSCPTGIYAYGPKAVRQTKPPTVGMVIWLRESGFYSYQTVLLVGVWAVLTEGETVQITVGSKQLDYAQATYNPEPYHALIRKDYRPYYRDDNRPPADGLLTLVYTPAERLQQRSQIAQALRAYGQGASSPPPSA